MPRGDNGMAGMIHIYCGDGKGKTTAAIGLAVRQAGYGQKVLLARFLKNERSGELKVLSGIEAIEVVNPPKFYGFYNTLSMLEKEEVKLVYQEFWRYIMDRLAGGEYAMLVMDEFMAAFHYGIIERGQALWFLRHKPEMLEIILTGRDPTEELLNLADYVSEIKKQKPPFDKGIGARKGIEF